MNEHQFLLNKQFLTEKEVAKTLGFSIRTIQEWRVLGIGPKAYKFGAKGIRYRSTDLIAWIMVKEFVGSDV